MRCHFNVFIARNSSRIDGLSKLKFIGGSKIIWDYFTSISTISHYSAKKNLFKPLLRVICWRS